jgi:hypothetical protein
MGTSRIRLLVFPTEVMNRIARGEPAQGESK